MKTHKSLPEDAKRVFNGVIFDVYHWEQELFDGTHATFEMLRRTPSVVVIPVIGDEIMLNSEEQPGRGAFLSLPAGRVDDGEEPEAAAARELLEETGYEAGKLEYYFTFNGTPKIDWPLHYYIAKDCVYRGKHHHEAGERISNYLVSFDEFFEEVEREAFRDTILKNHLFRIRMDAQRRKAFHALLFG